MPNLWRILPTLGKSYLIAECQMNGNNGGILRFRRFGTPPAKLLASPATGTKHQVQGTDK
jgi:hypothetical protein